MKKILYFAAARTVFIFNVSIIFSAVNFFHNTSIKLHFTKVNIRGKIFS